MNLISDRKLRLLACAIARNGWNELYDRAHRRAVEIGEDYVEGLATTLDLRAAYNDATAKKIDPTTRGRMLMYIAFICASADVDLSVLLPLRMPFYYNEWSHLIRDIAGNPFRKTNWNMPADSVVRSDLSGLAYGMAREAYELRKGDNGALDNERLLVVADLLEDIGCEDVDVLKHLRSPGIHVRGCWVLDRILRKV